MILPEFFDACDECGRPFEPNTTYPVLTASDDGAMELYSFCDDECLATWQEDSSAKVLDEAEGEVLDDADGEAEA